MIEFVKLHPMELLPGILLSLLMAFFQPIANWILVIVILVLFDHVTALRKAKKMSIPLDTKKARATLDKLLFYSIVIVCCHLVDGWAFPGLAYLPEGMPHVFNQFADNYLTIPAAGYIMYRELWSILENTDQVTGVGLTDHMKARMDKFRKMFK